MNSRTILLALFFLLSGKTFAQNETFQKFARQQDSLMLKASHERNPEKYLRELKTFSSAYDNLSAEDRKKYLSYKLNAFYNLSCTYSLMSNKTAALEYLKKCIDAGYSDYTGIQKDPDFDNIRREKAYKDLLQPLREAGDYMYILKRTGSYNTAEKQELPAFTYQGPDDPNLAALRKAFNLDSVAGSANEVSRILNLMHWVHNLIPHDGSHGNPLVKNAMSMIRECKQGNRGLNCRGLATVLNECYLAMGIKSRFITCLPKDSLGTDQDCHVINMVYSTQLKKWLWIDPTFDAYVMNEKGVLLSIEEVRSMLINDQPLILNPEANWNHKESQTKEDYLYHYMAKNLYILECSLSSEYDTETTTAGKTTSYLRLIPLDYFKKTIEKGVSTNTETKTKTIVYRTNNPQVFWQAP